MKFDQTMKNDDEIRIQLNINNNSDIPTELYTDPKCLIGMSGLDTINNAIHKSIWDTFSTNRRPERVSISYKLITNDHEFPMVKPKRNQYDWYIPKGIFKKNWMSKYLYDIPAVIAIFYELDWADLHFNEKMMECASRVQSIRAALDGRNTHLVVVLIQTSIIVPGTSDVLASDRTTSFCARCNLKTTNLFVLPMEDHLQGYVVRLENAFYESAQSFYHDEIRYIGSHKDHLNKTNHQYLFVRHQFKMGFLYELKQDLPNAHKHYLYAYSKLLEVRIVDTNALEIRTIAGFINYKLCRVMFTLNLPRDAISQFKSHIDRFKNRIGFQELGFEHYAWLSKQYCVFGDIFDEAVKLGLPAVQTQHPGIYYQQAAQWGIARKKSCMELCSNVEFYPNPDPLVGADRIEFYGQRPWRPGKLSAEPPDPQLEISGIQAIQYLEKQIPHSTIIISLFGLAISQYKTYKCMRTRRHLVLQMADEYYESRDYGKALTLLTHMLCDFRTENWWSLLSHIFDKALKCAYVTASVKDYISLTLEVLGKFCVLEDDYKSRMYENLTRLLLKQIPFGDASLPKDCLANAVVNWQSILKHNPINISLDMANILSCIETKARFLQHKYEIDQMVSVEIFVRNTSRFLLNFSRISVTIDSSGFSSKFAVNDTDITFKSNEVKRFLVEFLPNVADNQKKIEIGAINLVMGNPNIFAIDLKFGNLTRMKIDYELTHFKYTLDKLDFDNIKPLGSSLIVPRHSKLKLNFTHEQPALLGEWYRVELSIYNEEDYSIQDIQIETYSTDNKNDVEIAEDLVKTPNELPFKFDAPNAMQKNANITLNYYLRASRIGEKILEYKITYTLNRDISVCSIKTETLIISVIKPFEIKTKFLSKLMDEIGRFYVGEEIGIMPTIHCISPWPIIIEETTFDFELPFKNRENSKDQILKNLCLDNKEIAVELFLGACDKSSDVNVIVGQYVVKWKRKNGLSTRSEFPITGLPCDWIPLELKLEIAPYGFVQTPILVSYHFYNKSYQLIQLDVSLESCNEFIYAGYKQTSISILPESSRIVQYNLYPLIPGSVALPKLNLTIPENSNEGPALRQDQLVQLVDRSLPTHIYVMPQSKNGTSMDDALLTRFIQNK